MYWILEGLITGSLTLAQSGADFAGAYIPLMSCCRRAQSVPDIASTDFGKLTAAAVVGVATAMCTLYFEGPIIHEQLQKPCLREVKIGDEAVTFLGAEDDEEAVPERTRLSCCARSTKWSGYGLFALITLFAWYMNSATLYAQLKGRFFSDGNIDPLESSPAELTVFDFVGISIAHVLFDNLFYLFSEIYGTIEGLEFGGERHQPILEVSDCLKPVLGSAYLQNFVRFGGSASSTVMYTLPMIFWVVPDDWDLLPSLALSILVGIAFGLPKFASALLFYGHKCVENMMKLAGQDPREVTLPFDLGDTLFRCLYYALFLEGPMHAVDIATTIKGGLALFDLPIEIIIGLTIAAGVLTLPGASLAKTRDAQDALVLMKQQRDQRQAAAERAEAAPHSSAPEGPEV